MHTKKTRAWLQEGSRHGHLQGQWCPSPSVAEGGFQKQAPWQTSFAVPLLLQCWVPTTGPLGWDGFANALSVSWEASPCFHHATPWARHTWKSFEHCRPILYFRKTLLCFFVPQLSHSHLYCLVIIRNCSCWPESQEQWVIMSISR